MGPRAGVNGLCLFFFKDTATTEIYTLSLHDALPISARLRAYPAYMSANRDLLREGLASGLTAPRIIVERTIAQLERLLEIPVAESPVAKMAKVSTEEDRDRVRDI